jgi:hypothetical protein
MGFLDAKADSVGRQAVAETPVTIEERRRSRLALAAETHAGGDQALGVGRQVARDLDDAVGLVSRQIRIHQEARHERGLVSGSPKRLEQALRELEQLSGLNSWHRSPPAVISVQIF